MAVGEHSSPTFATLDLIKLIHQNRKLQGLGKNSAAKLIEEEALVEEG
jgi:hypothetical protein